MTLYHRLAPLKPLIWPRKQIKLSAADRVRYFAEHSQGKVLLPITRYLNVVWYKRQIIWQTNRLPKAPSVIILAVRCDPHQDFLPRPERAPQTVQVAVFDVQDRDGSLRGKRKQTTQQLLFQSHTNPEFCLYFKTLELLSVTILKQAL